MRSDSAPVRSDSPAPWFDLAETKRELDVPEHYSAVFPMAVGYPAGATAPPPRDEPHVVSWKWDAG
jgi:hypothetical protein